MSQTIITPAVFMEGASAALEFLAAEGWRYDGSTFAHCAGPDQVGRAITAGSALPADVAIAFWHFLGCHSY